MFERSTKTRQTLDLLGNVYRNSKWTDLKIQNIKSAHLAGFTKVNMFLAASVIISSIIIFRLELSSISSALSVVNSLLLIFFDVLTYSLSLISIYVLALYSFLQAKLRKLFGFKIESLDIKNYNTPAIRLENSTRDYNTALLTVNLSNCEKVKTEASALKSMFSLKQDLDLKVSASLMMQEYKLTANSDTLSYALNTCNTDSTNSLSSLLYRQELDYLNTSNYITKFNKLHLSDLSSTSSSQDVYTNLILENSMSSSLSSANATRWLIKMSPLSESLTINNSYATNIKNSLGSSITNSQINSTNIWLTTLEDVSSQNFTKLNLAFLNNFEDSRLWNQKRLFFTILPKLALTSQKETLSVGLEPLQQEHYYKSLLLAFNTNYVGAKNSLIVSLVDETKLNELSSLSSYTKHSSSQNLNLWNSLDKYYVTSLFNTNNISKTHSYYDYSSKSSLYKNL